MKSNTLIKRFNWTKTVQMCMYDCDRTLAMIHAMTINYPSKPNKIWQFIADIKSHHEPDCWLLNPVEFFLSNSTNNEKCVYLDLASKRNWAEYELSKETTLPLYVAEEYYNIKLLESNVLLEINNESIDFKY